MNSPKCIHPDCRFPAAPATWKSLPDGLWTYCEQHALASALAVTRIGERQPVAKLSNPPF